MKISKTKFGDLDGKTVWLFTLENDAGMKVKAMTYGGIITSIVVPDKKRVFRDVVLGFDNLEGYLKGHPYFGSIIGRYANRIAGAKFTLNGKKYELAKNNGSNHLHGGMKGFDKVLWDADPVEHDDAVSLQLDYVSRDGEEGYPGALRVKVIYKLDNENNLEIKYTADTDRTTVLNLTHHDYFNLSDPAGDILDHEAFIRSEEVLENSEYLIPTGRILRVEGTPLDFRKYKTFGKDLKGTSVGYDHCFVLSHTGNEPEHCATVYSPASGIALDVLTTEPGLQLYTANYLDGKLKGKKSVAYPQYGAFCLETQHYPDSPNHPAFPSTILNPGDIYTQKTIFRFYVKA